MRISADDRLNRRKRYHISASLAGISLFLGRLAVRAQRQPPVTGPEALIGMSGRARTAIGPGRPGQIDVRGEIWRAESTAPIEPGDPVRVVAINGLTLSVEPAGKQSSPIGAEPRRGAE